MPSTKEVLSAAASLAASAMLVRSIMNDFLPYQFQHFIFSTFRNLLNRRSSQLTIIIEEFDRLTINRMYEASEIYLGSKVSPSTRTIKVSKNEKEKNFIVSIGQEEEILDVFEGIQFKWKFICRATESLMLNPNDLHNSTIQSQVRCFELSFDKKHKEKVISSYFPYILIESKAMKEASKEVKLHTVEYNKLYGNWAEVWESINLKHPSTFDTLAMDSEIKRVLMEDLDRFLKRKEFYRRVGKAWKRGYLLYGPPGTGKSSLIAAMANFLNFDIYDLELSQLRCNSELRKLLIAMPNQSILIIEDIDCTIELENREEENEYWNQDNNQVTLSGLLNFIDGLWSSCGDERIIVFTTNHKDRLDPALLRPGRMDMHIHMTYCTPCGFKLLAANYLGVQDNPLIGEIEELIKEVEVTPAEVAEELMANEDPDIALRRLFEFLQGKKMESIEKQDREKAWEGKGDKSDGKEPEGKEIERQKGAETRGLRGMRMRGMCMRGMRRR